MSDGAERDDDDVTAGMHEAEAELTDERARAGLDYEGAHDDAEGLTLSPFYRLTAAYEQAGGARSSDAQMQYHFGRQFFQVELYAEAAQALRRAAELEPRFADAHHQLAGALRKQGKTAEAEAAYRRALEIDPELVEARAELAALLKEPQTGHLLRTIPD